MKTLTIHHQRRFAAKKKKKKNQIPQLQRILIFLSFSSLSENFLDGSRLLPVGICASITTISPPGPAMTVVFASFSLDAAVSVRGIHPGVRCRCRHLPLVGLERRAGCRLQTVKGKRNKRRNKKKKKIEF